MGSTAAAGPRGPDRVQNHLDSCSWDAQTRQHLLAAFEDLRVAFSTFDAKEPGNEDKTRSIFTWLYKMPDGYIDLLLQINKNALCILAFFCIMLHKLEHNWWLKGGGIHLINRVYTAVDDAHHASSSSSFWVLSEVLPWKQKTHKEQFTSKMINSWM